MIDLIKQCEQECIIEFYNSNSLNLVGKQPKLVWKQKEGILQKFVLSFQIDFEQYAQADFAKFFNQDLDTDSTFSIFRPGQSIELTVSPKPDLLCELAGRDISSLEHDLSQLNVDFPNHPLFFADNWFLLHAKQHRPSGPVIYRTIWDYLNPATLTADNIDTEEVAEAISNYFQDWIENNLTTEAFETAFQDLTQDLETWFSEKFTTTDAEELTQLFTDLGQSLETLANADDLNNLPFSKLSLLDTVIRFFTQDDWSYSKIQGEPTLRLAFQGKNGNWPCYAQVHEDSQKLAFYSLSPTKVPKSKHPAIAEFITRANYGMILGNFELDYSDGEIRYKTSIDVEGDNLTPALIQNLVYTNVMTMDQYLPGLLAVLEQDIPPEQAIALVEQDQVAAPLETARQN